MEKYFKVAEHRFRLSMPDSCPLWQMMGAYEPFITDGSGEMAFSLSYADTLPETEKKAVYTEIPEDEGQSRIELYRTPDGGWWFEMSPTSRGESIGCLMCDERFTEGRFMTRVRNSRASYVLNNSLMLLFAFRTAVSGTLEMHSSVVMKDGKGYMFLGKSGTGKSTHSRQWLEHIPGTELLNDDNPIIRVSDSGEVRVYGSPWSGKTPCYKAKDVPVGAIVRIRQCPENRITRYSILESYASIYSSCSGFKADATMADGLHATLEKVVTSVPCYVLDCRPDHDAADVCYAAVK